MSSTLFAVDRELQGLATGAGVAIFLAIVVVAFILSAVIESRKNKEK